MSELKKWYVEVREVHVSLRAVWANNAEDAVEEADGADEVTNEYSHTLDKGTWTAEEAKDE